VQIVVLDETSVAGVETGPGSPAYFSRHLIKHLRAKGHTVTIVGAFDEAVFAAADVVWSEWVTRGAYEAAASGVCKKLILRLRGFDVWSPLHTMVWTGVDAVVYESAFIKQLVYERPSMHGFQLRDFVIPSGVDLSAFPFQERRPGPVVALIARATSDKGYQLAMEWARQRQDLQIHVTAALGEANPRLIRYLATGPSNFHVHDAVDTAVWLDAIDANYLLSASIWETLGYTIAEAMAMGIKPLLHDAPGIGVNWPVDLTWRSLEGLDNLIEYSPYDSRRYRQIIEEEYDAAEGTRKFVELLYQPSTRQVRPAGHTQRASISRLISQAENTIVGGDLEEAAMVVAKFRQVASTGLADERAGLTLGLAAAYYNVSDLDSARVWATRVLIDGPNAPAMCLLGDIAEEQADLEGAIGWYSGAVALPARVSRYRGLLTIGTDAAERLEELKEKLQPKLAPGEAPKRYLIVVPVRNGAKWISACVESIAKQDRPFLCVVIDDASTDGTSASWTPHANTRDPRFVYEIRNSRRWSLPNIVHTIGEYGRPGDVVVIVDGDDRLADFTAGDCACVLDRLDEAYAAGAWMTYGSFVDTNGHKWLGPYPRAVVQAGAFRKHTFQGSHLKTFKIELFDRIRAMDLRDDGGEFFHTAGDVALMLPMLEMACERAVYITETLYIYNMETPDADHVVDPDEQVRVRDLIYARAPYKRLEKL
jgi:hypothetical protein